jgi:hypothetical protein
MDTMEPRAAALIAQLQLAPHPEGGFYAEVHRSSAQVDPGDGRPPRAALTAIYFLLVNRGASRWHRVRSDEVWCHLEGAPVLLHQLDLERPPLHTMQLAPLSAATVPQATVPAGVWQAAQCEGAYSLVACMVAPGFDFDDFTLTTPGDALQAWLAAHKPDLLALA